MIMTKKFSNRKKRRKTTINPRPSLVYVRRPYVELKFAKVDIPEIYDIKKIVTT